MIEPVIRAASTEDSAAIAELIYVLACRFILPGFGAAGQQRFLEVHDAESIAERIAGNFRYHVAETGEGVVGVVGTRDDSHLYHLFVAESYQGRGLGRSLWDRARAECLAHGSPDAFTVSASINAVPIYESFGFVVVAPLQNREGVLSIPMKLPLV
jgi:GNAT superfamily N-acetyltransferase